MSDKEYDFTRGRPIERFHNTRVKCKLKSSDELIIGQALVDISNKEITIRDERTDALFVVEFSEIELLRWPYSGLVRDHYFDLPGENVHVPPTVGW